VTIHTYGIPALVLMENAGRSCTDRIFRILEEKVGAPQEASVAVVCGKGNNGGDGMVIARHLHNRGVYVEVFLLGEVDELSADARTQHEIIRRWTSRCASSGTARGWRTCAPTWRRSTCAWTRSWAPASPRPCRDRPRCGGDHQPVHGHRLRSGHPQRHRRDDGPDPRRGDPGGLHGTFGLLKLGHVLLPGSIHCGETEIYDIGIPSRAVFDANIKTEALDELTVKSMLSVRPPDFHKGDAGRVYIVGGLRG